MTKKIPVNGSIASPGFEIMKVEDLPDAHNIGRYKQLEAAAKWISINEAVIWLACYQSAALFPQHLMPGEILSAWFRLIHSYPGIDLRSVSDEPNHKSAEIFGLIDKCESFIAEAISSGAVRARATVYNGTSPSHCAEAATREISTDWFADDAKNSHGPFSRAHQYELIYNKIIRMIIAEGKPGQPIAVATNIQVDKADFLKTFELEPDKKNSEDFVRERIRTRAGLPAEYVWSWGEAFSAALGHVMINNRVFKNKTELQNWVQDWLSARHPTGETPSKSQTLDMIKKFWP